MVDEFIRGEETENRLQIQMAIGLASLEIGLKSMEQEGPDALSKDILREPSLEEAVAGCEAMVHELRANPATASAPRLCDEIERRVAQTIQTIRNLSVAATPGLSPSPKL